MLLIIINGGGGGGLEEEEREMARVGGRMTNSGSNAILHPRGEELGRFSSPFSCYMANYTVLGCKY